MGTVTPIELFYHSAHALRGRQISLDWTFLASVLKPWMRYHNATQNREKEAGRRDHRKSARLAPLDILTSSSLDSDDRRVSQPLIAIICSNTGISYDRCQIESSLEPALRHSSNLL